MNKKNNIFIFVLFVFLLAACSSNESDGHLSEESAVNASKSKTVEEEADDLLSLENDGVDEEDFQKDLEQFPEGIPERIITTSVPITEMLHLLDITPVGVPTSTNPIPADFDSIDQIGSPMQPDLEVITDLEPDLIIGARSLEDSLEENLEGIEINRAYLKTDSFDDLKRSFKVLGTYFDQIDPMNDILGRILDMENDLIKQGEGEELPSVLLIIGTSDSFMVMSETSYLGSIVEKIGAENIATTKLDASGTYSPMNMEDVVAADPDMIFVLASGDHGASEDMFQNEVESNDIWKSLSAYTNDQIHILENDTFGVASIKNVEEAMTQIAGYFYE